MASSDTSAHAGVIERTRFPRLFDVLRERTFTIVGPTVSGGAIVCDEIESVEDLPVGCTDAQEAGSYHLKRRDDDALFGYVAGPHSWKKLLHPPSVRLWRARRENEGMRIISEATDVPKYAFLGVRPCDLHAIRILDGVLLGNDFADPVYRSRRDRCLVVAVNCTQAGNTCFCVSMDTGPRAIAGHDLAITELLDERRHEFLIEAGSERGAGILSAVPCRPAVSTDLEAATESVARAASRMGRSLDTNGIRELLRDNPEHPRWQDVAARCVNCANCTMVCPTCFCTTMEDTTDLSGQHAERWRKWDSCFTVDFSYIHGGSVRPSPAARYRHWMTHKLSTWYDQFGTSGCVGCGRCITWCPVGIDITEEARAIREGARRGAGRPAVEGEKS